MKYSCVMLCAAPQAPDATMKINKATIEENLRVMISLTLAQTMINPLEKSTAVHLCVEFTVQSTHLYT